MSRVTERMKRHGYDEGLAIDRQALLNADWWYLGLDPADRAIVDSQEGVDGLQAPTELVLIPMVEWKLEDAVRIRIKPETGRATAVSPRWTSASKLPQPGDDRAEKKSARTERVERVLAKLKPRYVDIMRAKHIEGKTYQEVAAIAGGSSRGSAHDLVRRAERAFLRAWELENKNKSI